MKVKLTKNSAAALLAAVARQTEDLPQRQTTDYLLRSMMERLAIDLYKKTLFVQKQYSFSWHPERCLAFYAAFEMVLPTPAAQSIEAKNHYSTDVLAVTTIRTIMHQIHREVITPHLNRQ